MTVSSTVSKVSYSGNGSTTTFTVSFYFLDNTHLKVIKRSSLGVETTLTLTTDYTVTGAGVLSGGSITTTVAPALGETLVIVRNVPLTQEVDYQANDPFPAETHEKALDKLTMEVQQVSSTIGNALRFPDTDSSSLSAVLPSVANRAGNYLAFDSIGQPIAAGSIPNTLYYGSAASNPTSRPGGTASQSGDMYFNTTYNVVYVYNGTSWVSTAANLSSFTTQTFNGTGAQTAFTLSGSPVSIGGLEVFLHGVRQVPNTDYTLSGTTLTFTSAPPSGTANIFALWMSVSSIGVPASGTVGAAALDTSSASGTGALEVPSGTTAQRPAAPAKPLLRFNSTTGQYESWNTAVSAWTSVGGGATGGGSNAVFMLNDQTVTTSYSIPSGKNALTAGPISIADGVTVTIPDGSVWSIV